MIKQLTPELEPVSDAPFSEGFEHIITASLAGVSYVQEHERDKCQKKAWDQVATEREAAETYADLIKHLNTILKT